jgi:hypothetical protein
MKGKHSFAFLDMETKDATLPATIKCNGNNYVSNGVSVCQSKEGLEQSIEFDTPVVWSPEAALRKQCRDIKYEILNGNRIIYEIPNRECVYIFTEKGGDFRQHRLNTIGYEEILIREL